MELSPQQDVYYIDTVSSTDYFIDTVTPSAIQLNKEKIMSIELDGPLYLGSNSMQQQVDQNTADIADLKQDVSDIESDIGNLNDLDTADKSSVVNAINEALSVLDPTQTADYINNSKGLKSGDISTNSTVLHDIKDYAHSTFDLNKFTVVGSPIITDDGIAGGFSTSNYLSTTLNNNGNLIEFECRFKIASDLDSETMQDIVRGTGFAFGYQYYNSVRMLRIKWGNNDSSWDSISYADFNTDTWYRFEGSFDVSTGESNQYLYDDNGTELRNRTNTLTGATVSSSDFTAYIGTDHSSRYLTGAVDLKNLSLKVDGALAFSGNKTGIDTIKPDNYTVVGTPTISADGITSGFSTSDYLTATLNNNPTSSVDFECRFKLASDLDSTNIQDIVRGSGFVVLYTYYNSHRRVRVRWGSSTDNNLWSDLVYDSFAVNTWYVAKGHYEVSTKTSTLYLYDDNGNQLATQTATLTGSTFVSGDFSAYIGTNGSSTSFSGSIDLNVIKLSVDGNLVYQPCLKIPYTESKTGSKIVDSIYRDRVDDMAEQFGFANYYTLDEDNGNFTLPKVELYGLMGQRTLRDSYRNGATYWELWSDRTLEIGGTCTSGVEYNLPRNFTSENDYILSIPYSAKTASSFTPTASGDFIAKGKGLL